MKEVLEEGVMRMSSDREKEEVKTGEETGMGMLCGIQFPKGQGCIFFM